jgi:hypothetical protein
VYVKGCGSFAMAGGVLSEKIPGGGKRVIWEELWRTDGKCSSRYGTTRRRRGQKGGLRCAW